MKALLTKLALFTSSPSFIAYNAHCWAACSLLLMAPRWWVAVGIVAWCVFKEFWFDIHFEVGENYESGAVDFMGYATGLAVAIVRLAT